MNILTPAEFVFPERLTLATFAVGETHLSRIAMINDHRFPWVLIVPRLAGVEEFHHMKQEHRQILMEEISALSGAMTQEFVACRVNVADIGNRVAQLHVHVVARQTSDALWPKVVWSQPRVEYTNMNAARSAAIRLAKVASCIPGFVSTVPVGMG